MEYPFVSIMCFFYKGNIYQLKLPLYITVKIDNGKFELFDNEDFKIALIASSMKELNNLLPVALWEAICGETEDADLLEARHQRQKHHRVNKLEDFDERQKHFLHCCQTCGCFYNKPICPVTRHGLTFQYNCHGFQPRCYSGQELV